MFDLETSTVYFRDGFIPFTEANVSIANTSLLYGLAIFTGIRANWSEKNKNLYIFRLQEHYNRLVNSCKIIGFKDFYEKYSYDQFKTIVVELIRKNNLKQDVYIRPSVFIDDSKITPVIKGKQEGFYVFLYDIGTYVAPDGIRCMISSWQKITDNSIPPRSKVNGAYVNTCLIKSEALNNGYDEAIVIDGTGHVIEGSAENLFIVKNGVVITPGKTSDILEGITRNSIVSIAKSLGYKVIYREIDRTELYIADEVFLTGTAAKLSPVIEIDHRKIGNGNIGKTTKQIQDFYFSLLVNEKDGVSENMQNWLTPVY